MRRVVQCPVCLAALRARLDGGELAWMVAGDLGDAVGGELLPAEASALDDLLGVERSARSAAPRDCCKGVGVVMAPCACAGRVVGCMWCEGDGEVGVLCRCIGAQPLSATLRAVSDGANDGGDDDDCF